MSLPDQGSNLGPAD